MPTTELPTPETSGAPSEPAPTQPLSKKAQKKLARAARTAELKLERRAAEKERKKEKKRLLAQKRAAGELDAQDVQAARKKRRTGEGPRTAFGARVVVDLGFDDMMTENEIKSLTSQLAYTYSANKRSDPSFSLLLFTSLNGRTLTRMEAMSDAAYKRWVAAEFWTEGYEAVVYLTADADEELTELREDETYIIGGICDHNRYKSLCLNKARESGIRAARLPIGTYLAELRTRKVLTVNQAFEILLRWVETRDWEKALWAVVPKRKFQEGRRRGKGGKVSEAGDTAEGQGDADDGEADAEDGGEDADDIQSAIVLDERTLEDAEDDEADDPRSGHDEGVTNTELNESCS
ncbi:hypothetical protein POSPLADRAFT_1150593 [Postia placenta MAD-698-R-SB12]|uniref:tRNA (guanine(9)-N1)-methyltransferase n=1 Tax=Postia placenta MAD-698-R-SB12 TaxID=670580 RepID=A0A1X6MT13_9APHY|nr:hypothetical protein POSPLADRAFT_1150593 [Postia placenta MAD-698-R-SB12]OSX59518.1 hypothetical protein POSPLADRAFT_1150593 [Postia placenta MAD-698-R-SB12]